MTNEIRPAVPKNYLFQALVGLAGIMILAAIATPNLLRSRTSAPNAFHTQKSQNADAEPYAPAAAGASDSDRMIIRKAMLVLTVNSPREALDQVLEIVNRHNGYIVNSELNGTQAGQAATITLRVPAVALDQVREQIKKIAKGIESEHISADDVAMQYAEHQATLRNYRAEEASYLEIMKRSGKISDTLEVAKQLSDARGRIENLEARIRTMQHQSAMAAISINLNTEPVVEGKRWRPIYRLRVAWEAGLDSLATYASAVIAIVLQLPAAIAWLITLVISGKVLLVVFRRAAIFLGFWKPAVQ